MSHTGLQAVRTALEVLTEGALGGQLQHHAEWPEAHAHQCHHPGVLQVAHDSQLLPEVLVAVQEHVVLVGLAEHLHCYRLPIVAPSVHLRGKGGDLNSTQG